MAETVTESRTAMAVTAASAVASFAVLAVVTVVLFEQVALGLVVGAFTGVGTGLMLPYVMALEESGPAESAGASRVHRGAVGFALSGSGIVMLAALFVVEDATLAVGVGLALAAVEYVGLSLVLPRARE